MSRQLIVHIGLPKTGSTSIQRMLYVLRPLLELKGIQIPFAGCPSRLCCHNNIALDLSGDAAYEPDLGGWAEFRAEIANSTSPTTLVSSEMFATRRGREYGIIERLAELAGSENLQTRVLAYVRPQYELLESRYSESVQGGGTATFDEYKRGTAMRPDLDFNAILGPWRDAFGSLAAFPVEASRLPQGLLSHFLGVLDVGWTGIPVDGLLPRQRVRRGAKELEVRRLANIGMSGLGFRDRWIRRGRLKYLTALLSVDPPFTGLSDTEIREIMDSYAKANAQFARDFGIDDDGLLFRDPPECRLNEPSLDESYRLSPRETRRVRRYVSGVAGIDLTKVDAGRASSPGPVKPLPPLKKWWIRPRVFEQRVRWTVDRLRWCVRQRRIVRHFELGFSPTDAGSRPELGLHLRTKFRRAPPTKLAVS